MAKIQDTYITFPEDEQQLLNVLYYIVPIEIIHDLKL